ncbi:MAG: putative restriction endonuclease [Thermomicrobiales bacterium]|nr:putative restriction endonuclease [Thermomicrobiales bacterium]
MPITAQTFEAVALEDTDGNWELHQGRLREKPPMSFGHNESAWELAAQLLQQLGRHEYRVFHNRGHVRAPNGATYVPDIAVVPVTLMIPFRQTPRKFEVYDAPLPFVAEVWSPKTGTYDIDTKFPAYRERGDAEIWRLHPFEQRLTIWRRQPDGNYEESSCRGGTVQLHALPSATIHIDELFVPD